MIGNGTMCDSYMYCEKTLMMPRKCLEIIEHYGFGVAIQTKSDRILSELDFLKYIHEKAKCVVQIPVDYPDIKC